MTKFLNLLPWIFICISLAYVVYRYEKNNNLAKEYYIIEGMTFYLIIGTLVSIILKYNIFTCSTGGLLFGILLGSILKKGRFY